jgi:hypothetical protein
MKIRLFQSNKKQKSGRQIRKRAERKIRKRTGKDFFLSHFTHQQKGIAPETTTVHSHRHVKQKQRKNKNTVSASPLFFQKSANNKKTIQRQ